MKRGGTAYDRDLKSMMRVVWVLLVGNAACSVIFAFRHEWSLSVAFLIWLLNIWTWKRTLQASQHTRDQMRVTEAAILKVLVGEESD